MLSGDIIEMENGEVHPKAESCPKIKKINKNKLQIIVAEDI